MSIDNTSDKILIDKFLKKMLQEEEKMLFNERKKDDLFLSVLEEEIIKHKGRLELKQKLVNIGNELKTEHTKTNKKSIFWMSGIAATLLLVLMFQFVNRKPLNSDTLFNNYFEAYPNVYSVKGDANAQSLSQDAFQLYDKAQYHEAITVFKTIEASRTLNSSEYFYYGIASLATQNIEQSKVQFRNVINSHPLHNEAQWYLSLALIKQDSLEKAKTILEDKNLTFSRYRSDKLKSLLKDLK